MAVNLSFIGGAGWQFFDNNGVMLSGGKLYTYAAGTTTPQTTFTSRDGLTANTNPIILDSAGRTPEQIWSTEGLLYKYVVETATDELIRSWDNIGGSVVASDLAQDLANNLDPIKGDALIGFRQSNSAGNLPSAVGKTVHEKFQETISVKDFGAVGDGVANDTAAIQAAITEAATTGKILYVNAGTYLIFSSIGVTLTSANKDLHINCDPSAVLKAASTFPVDTKFINILASSGLHNVAWFGGKIDGRLMPTKVAVAAPDALTINGGEAYIQKVLISNLNIILNDTRSGTAGDSCLFVAGCDDVSIVNNIFQGAVDLGVYISGQASTFVGERIYVAGNTFIECVNGVGSKRDYKSHIIDGNFFKDCGACVFIGGEVGANETAKKAVISNNALQRCARGIEARICDGTVISGNRIEDYGLNFGGAAVADAAILVSGSNTCVVSSNVMLFTGAYVPNAGAVGVRINARVTPTPTTFTSQYNLITGNNFKAPSNVNFAVQEVSGSGSNYNNILNNIVEGFNFNPPYSIVGANSNIGQVVTLLGADPILTIQDTETSIPSSIARLRLGESSAGGVLDNFLQIAYDGSSVGATFAFNATNVMQLNRTTFAVNFNPRTTLSDATGNAGDVYYDSSTNKLRCHNGTIWIDLF